ncbi:MAG: FemAB family XrtA/PEP-CTERM system-associated protein [Pirellulales bacterium]
MSVATATSISIATHWDAPTSDLADRWERLCRHASVASPSRRLEWLAILRDGLGHRPLLLEARIGEETVGMLPLVFMRTALFGKFLVSLPYLNVGGVIAADSEAECSLVDQAVQLADELDVKYLELRNEKHVSHRSFNHESTEKMHMRLVLPRDSEDLWKSFDPKVRNQIRKAEKEGLTVEWGREGLLPEFYAIFSRNMRDLGTPVFSRRLFASILTHLADAAELCVARHQGRAVAAALLVHGTGASEVLTASSLRQMNYLNGNMFMYWHLLMRSIERGQHLFDFGRSSAGSNTYRFKAQWGATPHPASWQYYVRRGSVDAMRPNHPKNKRRIAVWKRLPVWLTQLIGPPIVRGIP